MLFIISYDSLCLFAFLILPGLKRGLGPLSFGPASPGAFWGIVHPVGRARINWGFCMVFSKRAGHRGCRDAVRAAVDLFPNYSAVYDHQ